jgi:DNA-binding transcriptional regulator LsrR (DeoR family)
VITLRRLYQINSSRIFQHIRLNRGISRIAVASDLDLDRSTITKVVRQLMEDGLVLTTGKYHGKPGVGRMATGLEINPNFGLVLGIEVQAEFCRPSSST